MRRILLAVAMLASLLVAAAPAEARHGHCGWGGYRGGWGGGYCGYGGYYGGYRNCGYGWGGYGYGGCGYGLSIGYARPFYNYGWNYCAPSYIYGGYYPSYYYPTPIGYYGFYGSTYNPNSNINGLALSPNLRAPNLGAQDPVAPNLVEPNLAPAAATTAAQVLNLLRLDRGSLLADLRERPNSQLPRIGGLRETTITARPMLNQSNIAQRRKADQQIATGDMLFREQKFHAALQRYKDAARLAPDMAEPYWRQGHAMIATANFELAGGTFRRALALDPATGRDGFRLDKLYGPATIAKTGHFEDLAAWALDHSNSSESYFLMGVTLHYDGQTDRAGKFFARAAEMAGASASHIAAFAPPAAPAADALVEHAQPRQPPPPPVAQSPFAEPQPAQPVAALVEI